jgi:hypothetical protein
MGKAMKTSLYNWSIRRSSKHIIYNGFTGAIFELDEAHSHFGRLLEAPGVPITHGFFDEQSCEMLSKTGFLIDDDFDEQNHLESLISGLSIQKHTC